MMELQNAEFKEAFDGFDTDGSGAISHKELLELMKQKATKDDHADTIREAFKIFDRDKDGFVSTKELKKVTTMLGQQLTKEEVEEFMKEADVDGNGKLDYDEFVKMMLQQ